MSKLIRKRGDTSNILQVFIQDSSSTTGAGLTGLVFNSGSLTAYYHKDTDTTATAMTLVTMTVGTFTSLGFKEIDSTNMPGWYQFCPPDAALSTSGTPHSVAFHLKGATNMAPLALEVQLIAADVEDTVRLGLTALPNVASGSAGAIPTTGTGANQISVDGSGNIKVTSNVKKNSAGRLTFVMTDSTTHNPKAGLGAGVTATVSIDGAAFGATVNTPSEISSGVYTLVLAAADTNGNVLFFRFTAAAADDLGIMEPTQP